MRKPGTHCFYSGFLARETHGEKPHRVLGTAIKLQFFIHENALRKVIAVAIINTLNTACFHDVGTNSEYHAPITPSALRA